jgi:hypothetical protein
MTLVVAALCQVDRGRRMAEVSRDDVDEPGEASPPASTTRSAPQWPGAGDRGDAATINGHTRLTPRPCRRRRSPWMSNSVMVLVHSSTNSVVEIVVKPDVIGSP